MKHYGIAGLKSNEKRKINLIKYLTDGLVSFQKFDEFHGVEFCIIVFIKNKEKIFQNASV